MPLYFFALGDSSSPPDQDGEELPNDQDAFAFAETIADELGRNSTRPDVEVFDSTGKRLKTRWLN
jgi:hypothetical protein